MSKEKYNILQSKRITQTIYIYIYIKKYYLHDN